MSFTEKHRYSLYEISYGRNELFETFYMSQFPNNQEIFDALYQNKFFGSMAQFDEYKFERIDDKWFKPTVRVFLIEDYPRLIWEIRP